MRGVIPIRIYSDAPVQSGDSLFSGGGFVLGTLDAYDHDCRRLCAVSECTIIAVDYRLAPEHKFSTALEDCLKATCWVQPNISRFKPQYERLIVVEGIKVRIVI